MKSIKKVFIFSLFIVSLITSFICIKLVFFPVIDIKINNRNIKVGSPYDITSITVLSNNKKINKKNYKLSADSNFDADVIGEYQVKYIVNYGHKKYTFYDNIIVVDDIKPKIELKKDTVSYSKCHNNYTDDLVFKAVDNYDGDITDKVMIEKNEDLYKLSVKDSSNNETTIEVKAINLDKTNYKVKLNGSNNIYIKLGSDYKDEGAYATDNCGEKSEKEIEVSGSVNTNKVGTYKLTYKIKGTKFSATRTIHVFENNVGTINSNNGTKIVYLTFDDGPGQYTAKLLDILKKYNVKATFFVTNQFKSYVPLIAREHNEGHVVAVHTATHNWNIYQSIDTYMNDFNTMNSIIEQYTGVRSKIFRFPGGSSNTISRGKSKGIMSALASKMTQDGYYYFDWNVDSGDASGAGTRKIVSNVTKGISSRNYSVVLMHDIKKPTLNAIEEIIQYGLKNGYTFKTLDESSPTVHHHINN